MSEGQLDMGGGQQKQVGSKNGWQAAKMGGSQLKRVRGS